jgi:hypothetical protein
MAGDSMTRRRKFAQVVTAIIVIGGIYAVPGLIHMVVGG